MDKKIFIALSLLFMVFVGFQFTAPVSAVKVVDHGTKYGYDNMYGWMKLKWTTYQYNNNFLKTPVKIYVKQNGKYVYMNTLTFTVAKVTKNSVKRINQQGKDKYVDYVKTKLTAARYYWRIYRHDILDIPNY